MPEPSKTSTLELVLELGDQFARHAVEDVHRVRALQKVGLAAKLPDKSLKPPVDRAPNAGIVWGEGRFDDVLEGRGHNESLGTDAGEAAMLQRQNQRKNFRKLANSALIGKKDASKLKVMRDSG